jgi:hypothetical protein
VSALRWLCPRGRRRFPQGGESCFWQLRGSRISTAGGTSSQPQASRSESSTGPKVRTSFAIPMRRARCGCFSNGMRKAGRTSFPTRGPGDPPRSRARNEATSCGVRWPAGRLGSPRGRIDPLEGRPAPVRTSESVKVHSRTLAQSGESEPRELELCATFHECYRLKFSEAVGEAGPPRQAMRQSIWPLTSPREGRCDAKAGKGTSSAAGPRRRS